MNNATIFLIVTGLFYSLIGNAYGEEAIQRKSGELDEIIVTAQKSEENKQNVPISIDAFSDIACEDSGISNTYDMLRFSPNAFMFNTMHYKDIIIRGVSNEGSSMHSRAAYYINGVGSSLSSMQDNELFDIERVEILKGPQGTLYGANSMSGVINIYTRQPDNTFKGKALIEYGNYNSYRTMFNISGPVFPDKLFLGMSMQYRSSNGYITNIYNDDDEALGISRLNGRGTLRWRPSDQWDIALVSDIINTDNNYGVFRWTSGPSATNTYKVAGRSLWK